MTQATRADVSTGPPAVRDRGRTKARSRFPIGRYVAVTLTIVVIVLLWQLATKLFALSEVILPSPLQVVREIGASWPVLLRSSGPTLAEAGVGFGLGIVLGVPLGAVLARPGRVTDVLYSLMLGAQIFPKVAVAPLFIVWFGFDLMPKVLFVILLTFFPITLNTIEGFKSTPEDVRDLGRVLGMGPLARMRRLEFPSALPQILTGIKVSSSFAIIAAIVFEFVGSNAGLGYLIQAAQANLATSLMFAGLVFVTVIGFAFYGIIALVARLLTPWHVSNRSEL
jgi:NitT/TauT family transport system permease protein